MAVARAIVGIVVAGRHRSRHRSAKAADGTPAASGPRPVGLLRHRRPRLQRRLPLLHGQAGRGTLGFVALRRLQQAVHDLGDPRQHPRGQQQGDVPDRHVRVIRRQQALGQVELRHAIHRRCPGSAAAATRGVLLRALFGCYETDMAPWSPLSSPRQVS
eukprot:scaffold114421_cov51-Phaeocystis_antarctica.AAC.2